MKTLSVFLSLLLISPALFSQTTVSGVINSDQTWSKVNSPYIVEANVLVSTDVTLTIEAGVIIKFKDDTYLRIDGIIITEGDEDNYIVFESFSEDADKGSWEGIKLRGTSNTVINEDNEYVSGNKISYAKFKHASRAIYTYDNSVFISNSSFENNDKAIEIRATDRVILIESEFKDNNTGIYSEYSDYDSGDNVSDITNTYILNNHFQKNLTGISLNMNQRNFRNLNLIDNEFNSNEIGLSFGGGGYGPHADSIYIEKNKFLYDINALQLNKIYSNANSQSDFQIFIQNNIIISNNPLRLDFVGSTKALIKSNIIKQIQPESTLSGYTLRISGRAYNQSLINNTIISKNRSIQIGGSNSYNPSGITFNDNTLLADTAQNESLVKIDYGSEINLNSNNFPALKNRKYFIENNTSSNVTSISSSWGTIDESVISGLIYDYYDDFELGEVDYSNYLTAKNTSAPISPPVSVEKSTDQEKIKITWTANTESDIAGYKIYYGNYTGYSFSNSIDVGNVTEYTLDLPINYRDSTIAVTAYDTDVDGLNDITDGNESWYSTAEPVITFYLADNGVTIACPEASIGETGIINGVEYTKRSKDQITTENASTTCTSGITDMIALFESDTTFNSNINHWDVSSVESMHYMFAYATNFNQPLNDWDVSQVKHMSMMFSDNYKFNQPLNKWNVSNVINMNGMFNSASSFNQDINNWDVSNVEDMALMFTNAVSFNQPLNDWDVSSVTNMHSMFAGYVGSSFNQSLNDWNTSNVTDMSYMFTQASIFDQPLNNWNVSKVISMDGMFEVAKSFNQNINNWDVSNVEGMNHMFASAESFDQPLNDWDVSSVKTMNSMFASTPFNQDISGWNLENNLTTDAMFAFNTRFNQDISSWNVSSVENMQIMFYGATSFNQPIGVWDVSAVNNMRSMFEGATAFNQDLKSWCTSSIESIPENFSTNSGLIEDNLPYWGVCYDLFYAVKIDSMLSYGPEFTVEIKAENISAEDSIKAFNFTLTKPNGVTYKSYTVDGTHAEDGLVEVAETDSSVLVGFASNEYMSGEKPLIHLSFLDQDIVARDVHFQFTDFLYNNLVNYTEDIGLVGIVHNSGDVDSDGKIIAYDAAHALQYSVGLDPLPSQDPLPWEYWRIGTADVNFDGEILASDASDILKYSVGLINEFSPPVKGKAIVPQINVYASNKELRIESLGNGLFAMNLEFPIQEGMSFGEPSAVENVLMASNMTDTLFKLAVASTSDLAGNFLSIPITNIKGDEVLDIDYYLNNTFGQVQVDMSSWLTSNEGVQNKPTQFELLQNYPNPFNPSTQIQYALPEATQVTLEVFNSVGQKVMELVNGQKSAGYHTATFDASGLSSGVYLYKLTTPSFIETKKMLLIK